MKRDAQLAPGQFPKTCGKCNHVYPSFVEWRLLKFHSIEPIINERGEDGVAHLEQRDCSCASTLVVVFDVAEQTAVQGGWVNVGDFGVWFDAKSGLPTAWKWPASEHNHKRQERLLAAALGVQVRIGWGQQRRVLEECIAPVVFVERREG